MQLKTDKCNFIHLGRCVKSAALNIPHDSPWLIFPWSETPIISHEPNSTRMAQRSPRGQFSGHLPLTHHSCGNQPGRGVGEPGRRRRRGQLGRDVAAKSGWRRTYGGWERGEGRKGKMARGMGGVEVRVDVEWIWRGRWRRGEEGTGWRPEAGRRLGVGGESDEKARESQ